MFVETTKLQVYLFVFWYYYVNSERVYLNGTEDLSRWNGNGWKYINNEWRACNLDDGKPLYLHTKMYDIQKVGNVFVSIGTTNRKCSSIRLAKICNDDIRVKITYGNVSSESNFVERMPGVNTALYPMFYTHEYVMRIKRNNAESFGFVFTSIASCTRITKLKLFYYECPTSRQLTTFPPANAPNTGFTSVEGDCVRNSVKISTITMSCYHDGSIHVRGECRCNKGFFKNETRCQVCPQDTFKSNTGNRRCTKCGENSKSNTDRTKCICEARYFRVANERMDSAKRCYSAVPVQRLIYSNFTDGSVLVRWNVPIRKPGYNPVYLVTFNNKTKRMKERSLAFQSSTKETKSFTIQIVTELKVGNKTYRSPSMADRITVHKTRNNKAIVVIPQWNMVFIIYVLIFFATICDI